MDDYSLGNLLEKNSNPLVDFNYNMPKNKNKKQNVFEIYTPKMKPKKASNNDPKELFRANKKINSILFKNLKTIYDENKNDIPKDTPLFDNVNCLIQKNKDNNNYLYNQITNFKNQLKDNKLIRKESYNTFISNNSEKDFRNSTIIKKIDKLKNNNLFRTSIKNSATVKNDIDNLNKKKNILLFGSNQTDTRISNNRKEKKFIGKPRRNSSLLNNFKFNIKDSTFFKNDEASPNLKKKISKVKSIVSRKRFSNIFSPINKKRINNNIKTPKNSEKKSLFMPKNNNNNNINTSPNLAKKRYSLKMVNDNRFKINSNLSETRHSLFFSHTPRNLQIPTLRQIHSALARTLIESRIERIRKELDDHNNNEISEIINKLPKNKNEKKLFTTLTKMNLNPNTEIDKSEKNELLKDTMPLKEQIQYQIALEEDRYQKKYRKLYLHKNLYDSLDDEEAADVEEIYHFYISTNSITVYILDFIVLIASFIELYYLPVYLSLHISYFSIYYNVISSFIFYIIDFIYIIDLITGFFRAYHNFEEILIKKNADICLNYLTGWFLLDLVEAIPFFTLLDRNMKKSRRNFLTSNTYINHLFDFGLNNKYFALTVIKILKIFKTFSSNRFLRAVTKFFEKSQLFYEWKGLLSSIIITFSSLHFCTCFFIFIGKNEPGGWIVQNNLQDKTFLDIYITALYYQMTTLTTVGYGDIIISNSFETIYGIFILIVGTCAYSFILTYISNYIKKNNEKFLDFEEKMNVLSEIKLEYPNLNRSLYNSIIRYLNYNKSKNKFNLKFILESLPLSLQNNLIIEIYKPIIQNFQFFKSFENSDFFVKIVTSLKPILSMKDDILIQEGDIIEDIIFIKKGVLTLEIIIDLNEPKKSIESHLEMTRMECFKNITKQKFSTLMDLSSIQADYNSEYGKQIYNNQFSKKKEIKIIDLRKNEHYGDILMILNEKSPLTVKVKSKKAELFFLQKTEATEISNRYSNIWKRIVNRSLHNMKQIKNLIRKKIFLFAQTYNIDINPDLKDRYLKYEQNNPVKFSTELMNDIKISENIDIIMEEESNSNRSKTKLSDKNLLQSTKTQTQSNEISKNAENKNAKDNKFQINTQKGISVNYNNKDLSNKEKKIIVKDYKKNKSFDIKETKSSSIKNEKNNPLRNSKKNQSYNEIIEINKDITGVNDIVNVIDKEFKKSNRNKKNQINNFNIINIYTPKVQIPLNQINIENKNSNKFTKEEKNNFDNLSSLGKINSEISYSNDFITDIKDNNILMDNSDANNNMLFSNIKLIENKGNKNPNTNENDNPKIIKLFEKRKNENKINQKNKDEKTEDKKTNDKITMRSLTSDKSKINFKKNFEINKEKNKFSSLNTWQSISFSISSSYDNINQMSKFNYQKNSELREKTKKFILNQIKDEDKTDISIKSIIKNNKNLLNVNYTKKITPKRSIRKRSENIESKISLNKTDDISNIHPIKKSLIKHSKVKFDSHIHSPKKIDVHFSQDVEDHKKDTKKFHSTIHSENKRNSFKKKHLKRQESTDNTFYNKISRIKIMKKRNAFDFSTIKSENEDYDIKSNYEKLISKNIEKNQKNLNNPEEYFEGFFNDIIFKSTKNKSMLLEEENRGKKTFRK